MEGRDTRSEEWGYLGAKGEGCWEGSIRLFTSAMGGNAAKRRV